MAIKRGAEGRYDAARRRKRAPSPQVENRKSPSKKQDSLPTTQRVTRSLARRQSEIPASKVTSKRKSTKAILNGKAVSHLRSNKTVQSPRKEQPSKNCEGEKPAPERNRSQPLPLTKETLHLLDNSGRSHRSSSIASDDTDGSEATNASINAYDPGDETALNERFVFLHKGKPEAVPKDVDKIRAAVLATNKSSKPPKEHAGLVRSLLSKISGEPDMVS